MKQILLIDECGSPEHQLIFTTFPEDKEDNFVYIQIHLCKAPFWKRLIRGIKYIFGHTSRYGHFDEMIFEKEELKNKILEL